MKIQSSLLKVNLYTQREFSANIKMVNKALKFCNRVKKINVEKSPVIDMQYEKLQFVTLIKWWNVKR